jgi:hypothetical protein
MTSASHSYTAKLKQDEPCPIRRSALNLTVKPLRGGPAYKVDFADVKRFGKRAVYGNGTDFTVGELASGEVVSIAHKDQTKEAVKAIRARVKGLWAECGYGGVAVSEAFKWEVRMTYCENSDEGEKARCVIQCDKCRNADIEEAADAKSFRDNMERECKP